MPCWCSVTILLWKYFIFILIAQMSSSSQQVATPHKSCSGRHILNATTGILTDGIGNYSASEHCEWLIQGCLITVVTISIY